MDAGGWYPELGTAGGRVVGGGGGGGSGSSSTEFIDAVLKISCLGVIVLFSDSCACMK